MSVFMMTGYIKSIPKDIEESAVIDGANIMQALLFQKHFVKGVTAGAVKS